MPPKVKVKIKNDTSEMVAELARRLGVPTKEIQNEFHMYWQDVGAMFTHHLGHGLYIENFGNLIFNVASINSVVKDIEKKINKSYHRLEYLARVEKEKNCVFTSKKECTLEDITEMITRIILLDCTVKAYEAEVLAQYPKKYKPRYLYLRQYMGRLEKHFGFPLSKFPIYISNPIQEIFVRSMQAKGFLQNPLVHKNKKV